MVAIKLTNLFYCFSNLINFIAIKLDSFYYFPNSLTLLVPTKFYCSPNFIAPQIFTNIFYDCVQTLNVCKTRWTKFDLIHQAKFINRMFISQWILGSQTLIGQSNWIWFSGEKRECVQSFEMSRNEENKMCRYINPAYKSLNWKGWILL